MIQMSLSLHSFGKMHLMTSNKNTNATIAIAEMYNRILSICICIGNGKSVGLFHHSSPNIKLYLVINAHIYVCK